ncbi:hypothetical protein JXI42_13320 [bacterium]|nr:hypothetical protein [bacterium]
MNLNEFRKLLNNFNDFPVQEKNKFIDRESDVDLLEKFSIFYKNKIVGIAGERGIGKTSLLNVISTQEEVTKIIISIEEKESKIEILIDLLFKLAENFIHSEYKEIKKTAEKVIKFIIEEKTEERSRKGGLSYFVDFNLGKVEKKSERFILLNVKEALKSLMKEVSEKYKLLLCIDEIDKESLHNFMVIIDSIKNAVRFENINIIISMPPVVYFNYLEGIITKNSSYSLENIFQEIIYLKPLSNEQISTIMRKKLMKYQDVLPADTEELILDYAMGNPRIAVLTVFNTLGRKKHTKPRLEKKDVLEVIMPVLIHYMENLDLTDKENQSLKLIAKLGTAFTKNSATNLLERNEFPQSTAYMVFDKLVEKKVLIEKNNNGKLYEFNKYLYVFFKYGG